MTYFCPYIWPADKSPSDSGKLAHMSCRCKSKSEETERERERERMCVCVTVTLRLLILPKLLWHRKEESGTHSKTRQRQRPLHRNIHLAQEGNWKELMEIIMEAEQPTKVAHDSRLGQGSKLARDAVHRVMSAAKKNQEAKAWKQVRSPPPISCTQAIPG